MTVEQQDLAARALAEAPYINKIQHIFLTELELIGLGDLREHIFQPLSFTQLRFDSYDKSDSFYGEWRSSFGELLGNLVIHGGGQVYAEFDVLKPHPLDEQWFIEAVTAWGDKNAPQAELQLLAALTDQ